MKKAAIIGLGNVAPMHVNLLKEIGAEGLRTQKIINGIYEAAASGKVFLFAENYRGEHER